VVFHLIKACKPLGFRMAKYFLTVKTTLYNEPGQTCNQKKRFVTKS